MADEAEIYDGIRAEFPLSFGKQAKSQAPLELVHNATRRTTAAADGKHEPSSSKIEAKPFPSLSSSSKSWLNSLKNPKPNSNIIGPGRPPSGSGSGDVKEEEGAMIGPPRSAGDAKTEEDEDGEMIGPPRPPVEEEDELMIGPPAPPPFGSMGSDSEDDMEEEKEEHNQYRIPLSNEIILKGHTKVQFFFPFFVPSCYLYMHCQLLASFT